MTTTEKRFLLLLLTMVAFAIVVLRLDYVRHAAMKAAVADSEQRQKEFVCEALIRAKVAGSCTIQEVK
jgi:hypothetical protein